MCPLSLLLSAPKEQQDRFFDDVRDELDHAVRAFAYFVVGLLLLFSIEDWFTSRENFLVLVQLKVFAMAVIAVLLLVTRSGQFRDGSPWMQLAAASLIYASASSMSMVTGDMFMVPMAVLIGSVGTAVLLPWRLRFQVLFYLISSAAVLGNVVLHQGWPPDLPLTRDTIAGLVLGAASILLHLYANDRRFLFWQMQARLRDSDEQFHHLAEHSNDIIWIWRPDRSVEYLSDAYQLYTGRPPAEVLRSPRRALHMVIPEDRAEFAQALREINAGGTRKMDLRVRHDNGDLFHLEGWGTAIKDERGQVVRCIGIWRDVTERVHLIEDLDRAAITDPLTGAYNRRHFQARLLSELEQANRDGRPLGLIMLDIDHFKSINDQYGHAVGDEVLIEFVRRCSNELRPEALFARFGGEEFVVLLPETDAREAEVIARRLHGMVSESRFMLGEHQLAVTASVGIGVKERDQSEDAGALLQRVDQVMYSAKEQGRDRVVSG